MITPGELRLLSISLSYKIYYNPPAWHSCMVDGHAGRCTELLRNYTSSYWSSPFYTKLQTSELDRVRIVLKVTKLGVRAKVRIL